MQKTHLGLAKKVKLIKLNCHYSILKNFYSIKNFLIISSDLIHLLKKRNINQIPQKFKNILIRHDILMRDNQEIKLNFYQSDHLDVWLHVTNQCNLACKYCYIRKSKEYMGREVFVNSVDYIFRLIKIKKIKLLTIKFSGGEALLRFSHLKRYYFYIKSKCDKSGIKLKVIILSNGTIFSSEIASFIHENKINLMISLDGDKKYNDSQRYFKNKKGSFDVVWKNIKRFRKNKINPMISITLTKDNIIGLPKFVNKLLKNDNLFSFNFVRDINKNNNGEINQDTKARFIYYLKKTYKVIEKNLPNRSLLDVLSDRVYISSMKNHGCGAGINYVVINHKGQISFCHMTQDHPYAQIIKNEKIKFLNNDLALKNCNVNHKKSCKNCIYKYICAGGCSLQTYYSIGKFNEKSYYCEVYKRIIPQIIKLEGLRILKFQKK